ncbi:MAG: VirB8/TrbF family protein, partial [Dehalococcoidia bacterium]|nr:VirB8/TrbF family protein [Dehalococcoidia bacterium]
MTILDRLTGSRPRSVGPELFENAKRAYMERSSDSVRREQTWRTFALVLALGCAGLGWSNYVLANRPAFTPYLVQVDKHGSVIPIRPANDLAKLDDRVVMNQLVRFIQDTRTVYVDAAAARAIAREAYAMLQGGSEAYELVNRN